LQNIHFFFSFSLLIFSKDFEQKKIIFFCERMSEIELNKGLRNRAGENNCFLNVVIQSLWHLESFRKRFWAWNEEHHDHRAPVSCVFCALSVVFTQYAFCDEECIPPNALRNALHLIYRKSKRFEVGALDDAAEALDAVLTCLEAGMNKTEEALLSSSSSSFSSVSASVVASKSSKSNGDLMVKMLPHVAFGLTTAIQVRCDRCHGASKPILNSAYIYYTYAAALRKYHEAAPSLSFGELLRAITDETHKSCPSEQGCEARCLTYRYLVAQPDVLAIDVVWDTADPTAECVHRTVRLIPLELDLSHMFPSLGRRAMYVLRGMICYYGKHYNTYFFSYSKRQWLVYDDARVIPAGRTWRDIQERCRRGRFQPSVLFYEVLSRGHEPIPPPDMWPPTDPESRAKETPPSYTPPPSHDVDLPPAYGEPADDEAPPYVPPTIVRIAAAPSAPIADDDDAPPYVPPPSLDINVAHSNHVATVDSNNQGASQTTSNANVYNQGQVQAMSNAQNTYDQVQTMSNASAHNQGHGQGQGRRQTINNASAYDQRHLMNAHQNRPTMNVPSNMYAYGAPTSVLAFAPTPAHNARASYAPPQVQAVASPARTLPTAPPLDASELAAVHAVPLEPAIPASDFDRLFASSAPSSSSSASGSLLDELDDSNWGNLERLMRSNPNYEESLTVVATAPPPSPLPAAPTANFASSVLTDAANSFEVRATGFLPLHAYEQVNETIDNVLQHNRY
jgi:Ubiquitin carboxyl-terminal hydrolase